MPRFDINNFKINLSFVQKRVTSITYNGEELIHGNIPFFALKIRQRNNETHLLTAFDFELKSFEANHALYTHDECDVLLSLKQDDESLNWGIKVINHTDLLIEQIEIMSIGLLDKLKDEEGGKGAIVIPYNEGALVTNLNRRLSSPFPYIEPDYPSLGKYYVFPNMLCSQFIAYLRDGYGLYFGMHDHDRGVKHIDFLRQDNALKIQLRTYTNINYGEDYEMNFAAIFKPFVGNLYNCLDIYRDWFYQNLPNNLIKIKDNKALPSWYEESPLIVTYPVRGTKDADTKMLPNSGFYPYTNVIGELENIANKTASKVMTLLMHWEGTAPWAPPYSYPPFGGEEQFVSFVNDCHNKNLLVGLYTSGLGYTLESYRGDYNKKEEFYQNELNKIMCSNSNGDISSTVVTEIRLGYDLCPKMDMSKKLIKQETEKILTSGIDYVQVLDQNHGGCSYFCYSLDHGHPPVPGKWQIEEVNSLLHSIERGKTLFGCESAASEPFISELLFSDNRFILNYYIGMPIPLYGYIYHEFVNNFMGNQICMALDTNEYSFPYRLAYSFSCGDMFTLVLNNNYDIMDAWCLDVAVDKEVVLSFINVLNEWRRKQKEYLHQGKMIEPLSYDVRENSFIHEDRSILKDKAVLTAAFNSDNGNMQFLINYNLNKETVEFEEEHEFYLDADLSKTIKTKQLILEPLSVVAFKR